MSPFLDSTGEALEIYGEDFLVFVLAGVRYAIAYAKVEETRAYEAQGVIPLATSLSCLAGRAYVSGVDVPVIDLRRRLGLAPALPAAAGVILFVRLHGHRAGLLADASEGVTIVQRDRLEPVARPDVLPIPAAALLGEKKTLGGGVWLVDIEALLSADEVARAGAVVDAACAAEQQHA